MSVKATSINYTHESYKLKQVIFNYSLPLGVRIDAWINMCGLIDSKEELRAQQVIAAKEYEL